MEDSVAADSRDNPGKLTYPPISDAGEDAPPPPWPPWPHLPGLRGDAADSYTATFTLTGAASTTTTTIPPAELVCSGVASCRAALADALPRIASSPRRKYRRVARRLRRLDHRVDRTLQAAADTTGKQHQKLYTRTENTLTHLLAVAQAAQSRGTLGVPLDTIAGIVRALMTLLAASGG